VRIRPWTVFVVTSINAENSANVTQHIEADIEYLESTGQKVRARLATNWNVRFERIDPVVTFRSYRGQRNFPGLWWAATTGDHVGYQSWLERDHAMMLDFNRQVVAFSSRPFWLCWPGDIQEQRHAPAFFARLQDGTGVVSMSAPTVGRHQPWLRDAG
jgi:hypothetical protein